MFEISQHYNTNESVKALAEDKQKFGWRSAMELDDLDNSTVNWKLVAYRELLGWVEGHWLSKDELQLAKSLDILKALERTNPEAADTFRGALSCRK